MSNKSIRSTAASSASTMMATASSERKKREDFRWAGHASLNAMRPSQYFGKRANTPVPQTPPSSTLTTDRSSGSTSVVQLNLSSFETTMLEESNSDHPTNSIFDKISSRVKKETDDMQYQRRMAEEFTRRALQAMKTGDLDNSENHLQTAKAGFLQAGKVGAEGLAALKEVKYSLKHAQKLAMDRKSGYSSVENARTCISKWELKEAADWIERAKAHFRASGLDPAKDVLEIGVIEKEFEAVRLLALRKESGDRAIAAAWRKLQIDQMDEAEVLLREAREAYEAAKLKDPGAFMALERAEQHFNDEKRTREFSKLGSIAVEKGFKAIKKGNLEKAKEMMEEARLAFEQAATGPRKKQKREDIFQLVEIQRAVRNLEKLIVHKEIGEKSAVAAKMALESGDIMGAKRHVGQALEEFSKAGAMGNAGINDLSAISNTIEKLWQRNEKKLQGDALMAESKNAFKMGEIPKAKKLLYNAKKAYEEAQERGETALLTINEYEDQVTKAGLAVAVKRWQLVGVAKAFNMWYDRIEALKTQTAERRIGDSATAAARVALLSDQLDKAEELIVKAQASYERAEERGVAGLEKIKEIQQLLVKAREFEKAEKEGHAAIAAAKEALELGILTKARQKWKDAQVAFERAGDRATTGLNILAEVEKKIHAMALTSALRRWQQGCVYSAFAAWVSQTERAKKMLVNTRKGETALHAAIAALTSWQLDTAETLLNEAKEAFSEVDPDKITTTLSLLARTEEEFNLFHYQEEQRRLGESLVPELRQLIENWELEEATKIEAQTKQAFKEASRSGVTGMSLLKGLSERLNQRKMFEQARIRGDELAVQIEEMLETGRLDEAEEALEECQKSYEAAQERGISNMPKVHELQEALTLSRKLENESDDSAAAAREAMEAGDIQEAMKMLDKAKRGYAKARKRGAVALLEALESIAHSLNGSVEKIKHKKEGDRLLATGIVALRNGMLGDAKTYFAESTKEFSEAGEHGVSGWASISEIDERLQQAERLEQFRVQGDEKAQEARDLALALHLNVETVREKMEEARQQFVQAESRGAIGLEKLGVLEELLQASVQVEPVMQTGLSFLEQARVALVAGNQEQVRADLLQAKTMFLSAGERGKTSGLRALEDIEHEIEEQIRNAVDAAAKKRELSREASVAIGTILPQMKVALYDPDIQIQCFERLAALAEKATDVEHVSAFQSGELGLELVMQSCAIHSANADLQKAAFEFVAKLARLGDEEAKSVLIGKVISGIQSHSSTEPVLEAACFALGSLARSSPAINQLAIRQGAIAFVIKAMQYAPSHTGVQSQGCTALAELSRDDKSARIAIGAAGGMVALVEAMRMHPQSIEICKSSLVCIKFCMQSSAENAMAVAGSDGIPIIVAGMKTHASEIDLQLSACECLCLLAEQSEAVARSVIASGGLFTGTKLMSSNGSIPVQVIGCKLLSKLSASSSKNRDEVVGSGAIKLVVATMIEHQTHLNLQKESCCALAEFALNNPKHSAAIATSGGLGAAISALRKFSVDAGVQRESMRALWALVANNKDNASAVALGNIIESIVSAMKHHPDEQGLQRSAVQLLSAMLASRAPAMAKALESTVGGISCLIKALTRYFSDPVIQEEGCAVLNRVAEAEIAVGTLIDSEGIIHAVETIQRGMQQGRNDEHVQWRACSTLSVLSRGLADLSVCRSALRCVLEAVSAHPNSASLFRAGCTALSTLCSSVTAADAHSIVTCAENGMMLHSNDAACVVSACTVFHELVLQNPNEARLLQWDRAVEAVVTQAEKALDDVALQSKALSLFGVLEWGSQLALRSEETALRAVMLTLTTMKNHQKNWQVLMHGCHAISSVTFGSTAARDAAVNGGALPLVVSSMRLQQLEAGIQERGLAALVNLTFNNEAYCTMAVESKALDAAVTAMRVHPGHSILREWGCQVLRNLSVCLSVRMDIVVGGGMHCVLSAMEVLGDRSSIQIDGCATLCALAEVATDQVIAAGGIHAALEALRMHSSNAEVVAQATAVLWSCAYQRGPAILSSSAMEHILNALECHKNSAAVAQTVTAILLLLCCPLNVFDKSADEEGNRSASSLAAMAAKDRDVYVEDNNNSSSVSVSNLFPSGGMRKALSVMQALPDDAEVQQHVLGILSFTTLKTDLCPEGDGQVEDAALTVLSTALRFPRNEMVQAFACRAISATATLDSSVALCIAAAGGVAVVGSAMKAFPASIDVQRAGCSALWNLTVMCGTSSMAVDCGDWIVAAIRFVPEDETLVDLALRLLVTLCAEENHGLKLMTSDKIETVVMSTMKRAPSNVRIQLLACRLMATLVKSHRNIWDEMPASSAITSTILDLILHAMDAHQSHAALQTGACQALSYLIRPERGVTAEDGARMVPSVATCLQLHHSDPVAQDAAFRALSAISRGSPGRAAVLDLGLVPVIVDRMRSAGVALQQSSVLQAQCCAVIWNLSTSAALADALSSEGIFQEIIKATKMHLSDSYLQYMACGAIASLCSNQKDNITVALTFGAVPCILKSIEQHPDDANVLSAAVRGLGNIAATSAGRSALSQENNVNGGHIIELVAGIMRKLPQSAPVQASGAWFAHQMAQETVYKAELASVEMPSLVTTAIRTHPKDTDVVDQGNRALLAMGARSINPRNSMTSLVASLPALLQRGTMSFATNIVD